MEEKQEGNDLKERQPDSKAVAAMLSGTDESMSMSFANVGENVGENGNDEGPRTAVLATGAKLHANHGKGAVFGSKA
jgi:hypothetical protein